MRLVGAQGLAFAVALVAAAPLAVADDPPQVATDDSKPMDKQWPQLPHQAHYQSGDFGDQLTDHLTELGNQIGEHLDLLSHDYFRIHVDGRAQRARMRLGGGNPRYLEFRVDSDWHFAEGKARVAAKVELGLAGHELNVTLPAMDLSTDNYHGEGMVQVNIPVLERHF